MARHPAPILKEHDPHTREEITRRTQRDPAQRDNRRGWGGGASVALLLVMFGVIGAVVAYWLYLQM